MIAEVSKHSCLTQQTETSKACLDLALHLNKCLRLIKIQYAGNVYLYIFLSHCTSANENHSVVDIRLNFQLNADSLYERHRMAL